MSTSRVKSQSHSSTKLRLKFQNNTKEILTDFVKREEDFKQRDFKNMKKTLEINKELITNLIKDCKESGMRNGLLRLNEDFKQSAFMYPPHSLGSFSKVPPTFKMHLQKGVFLVFKLENLTVETKALL